jgi:hypothetical protein
MQDIPFPLVHPLVPSSSIITSLLCLLPPHQSITVFPREHLSRWNFHRRMDARYLDECRILCHIPIILSFARAPPTRPPPPSFPQDQFQLIFPVKFIRAAISPLRYRDVLKKITSSNDGILPSNSDFNLLSMMD